MIVPFRVGLLYILLATCCSVRGQVTFDGTDDYINWSGSSETMPTNITWTAWIRGADLNSRMVILEIIDSGQGYRRLGIEAGQKLAVLLHSGGSSYTRWTSDADLPTNTYVFVAGTQAGTNLPVMYINGEEVGVSYDTGVGVPSVRPTYDRWACGITWFNTPAWFFDGTIDDARIFSRVLSANEIDALYNKPWVLGDDPDLMLRTCIPSSWNHALVADLAGDHTATNHGVQLSQTENGWMGEFDGISFLKAGDAPFDFTTNMSVSFWITAYDASPTVNARIVHKNSAYGINVYSDGRMTCYNYGVGNYSFSTNTITENKRMHITMTKDSSGVIWYFDGNHAGEDTSAVGTTAYPNSPVPLFIGMDEDESSYPFQGVLSDIRMFGRVLTTQEISDIISGANIENPVANFTMQPTYQDTGSTLTGIALNLGFGADGAYNNGPTVAPGLIRHSESRHRVASQRLQYNTQLIRDMSGNGHTATNQNAMLYETSYGWEGQFDGSSSIARFDDAVMPSGSEDRSVAAFLCTDSSARQRILQYGLPGTSGHMVAINLDNKTLDSACPASPDLGLGISFGGSSFNVGNGVVVNDGNRHHVAFVTYLASNTVCFYIDGECVGYDQTAIKPNTTLNGLGMFGSGDTGLWFDGTISDLYIFDHSITSNDVFTLSSRTVITNTPIAHWTMQPDYR